MEEIRTEEQSWDKKKIVYALLVLLLLGLGIKTFVLDIKNVKTSEESSASKAVRGISSEEKTIEKKSEVPQFNPQRILQEKLESLKEEVQSINVTEIASSSPQIQKVLKDLKSLEQYPRNEAKELCQKICTAF